MAYTHLKNTFIVHR